MLAHRNIDLVSKTPMAVSTCIEGLCLSTFIQSFTPIIGSILDHFHGCISLPACLHDSSGVKGEEESNDVRFGGCSFTATTPVTTAQGKQPIGKLKPGEKVWAYNPRTHKMEWQPILHVWIDKDNDLVNLTITTPAKTQHGKPLKETSEVVQTNKKHPFFTIEKGFLPVGQIKVGMHVLRGDGRMGTITGYMLVPGVETMYNLEVAQDHTFTVGEGQWVGHNCDGGYKVGITAEDIRNINKEFGGIFEYGSPEAAIEAAQRREGFWNKTAVRNIVGGHMFDNGNKRTAFTVVEMLMDRNNIFTGASSSDIRDTINLVARGRLRNVEEIARRLRGF